MTVALSDASGNPISAFGSNSQWNQGAVTNSAQFSSQQNSLFGRSLNARSATTPALISTTTAGSTSKIGYTDPTAGSRRGAGSGGQLNPVAPPTATPTQQAAPGKAQTGGTMGQLADAAKAKWGPQPGPGEQAPTPSPSPSATGRAVAVGAYNAGKAAYSRLKEFGSGATEARDGTAPSGMFSATGVAEDLAGDL